MSDIERSPEQKQQAPEIPAPVSPSVPASGYIEIQRSSPIPAPHEFREYAALIPNGAERLMRMAEKQQDHEMKMDEKREVRAGSGVVSATLAVLGALMLSGYGFYTRQPVEAVAIFSSTLLGVVTVFIRGTATRPVREEIEEE